MWQVQRTNQYTFDSRVRFSEVDHTKKMTLPGIINYFQDCSTFQSEGLGYGVDYFTKYGKAWVLAGRSKTVSGDGRKDQSLYLGDGV